VALGTYRVYGLRIESELESPHLIRDAADSSSPPDLILRVRPSYHASDPAPAGTVIYEHHTSGHLALSVHELNDTVAFRYRGWMDFVVDRRSCEVTCFHHPLCPPGLIWHLFLGIVCAFLLRSRGGHCLHGSAVKVGEGAVVFVAPTGGGKSCVAAHFVTTGHALLSEDLIPIAFCRDELWAQPGPPQLRLWPDAAREIWADPATLPRHALGTEKRQIWLPVSDRFYCRNALRVRAIFLLVPCPTARAAVEPLSQKEAVLALVASVFANFLTRPAGLSAQLDFLGHLVSKVPCCKVRVPPRLDAIEAVEAAILHELGLLDETRNA
jgi:hypothetical protein